MKRLAKDDAIQAILQLNPSAEAEFLDRFETTDLAAYLGRLRGVTGADSTTRRGVNDEASALVLN